MLENYLDTLEDCRFCLMCRHVAPVGLITRQEALTPRGIALIVTSQRRGLHEWDAETVEVIYSEADGGNSRAHCVNDRPFEAAVSTMRGHLAAQGLAPALVYKVHDRFEQWGSPFGEQRHSDLEAGDVALFIGDAARHLWPDTLPAVMRLLQALNQQVVLVGDGRNNGFLAQSMGFPELAEELAKATLFEVEETGAKQLLALSPGDYFTFNQLYGERLGLEWPAETEVVEFTSLLAKQLAAGAIAFSQSRDARPYAYVDPTHAVRVPGRHADPRALLSAVMAAPPLELFWRRDRAQPAGDTQLQFSHPELAARLTRARLEDAASSGAQLLICDDPATLHQLNRFAQDYGLVVQGLYELLAAHVQQQ